MLKKPYSTIFIIYSSIAAWLVYSCAYIFLKHISNYSAGCFSLVGEVGLDITAAVLTFKLWAKSKNKHEENIFFIFFLSFIVASISDCIYNITLNFLYFQYTNPI